MKILIENYRNWQIFFDTDSENFYADTDDQISKEKKSYAAAKKYIDDFIKENNEFKPIEAESLHSALSESKITLIGIRKDGAFVYLNENGIKTQLPSCYEKDYFLVDQRNEIHFNKIRELVEKIEQLRSQVEETKKQVIQVRISEIRRNLLGN
jgi:regulator of replication initiation timing